MLRASADHETFVQGSEREGWWWGCVVCLTVPPNQFVFRRDAQAAADAHRRAVAEGSGDA